MSNRPLEELIENRAFDRYQPGLKSRFAAYRLRYELVYCEPTNKSAMYLSFESENQLGRVTVWVSGECEMEVLEKASGHQVYSETMQFNSEEEFFEEYPKLVLFMRDSINS